MNVTLLHVLVALMVLLPPNGDVNAMARGLVIRTMILFGKIAERTRCLLN
jgi:hypothetical protein